MNGAGTELPQGIIMGPGAVALVDLKAVFRVLLRHFQHPIIPGDLCQNGGCGNVGAEAVPFYHGLDRQTKIRFPISVNERQLRSDTQLVQRPAHSQEGRLQNVDFIDFRLGSQTDSIGYRLLLNLWKQLTALFVRQLLAVRQTRNLQVLRQNHRRRANRSRQRSSACFIHAANQL